MKRVRMILISLLIMIFTGCEIPGQSVNIDNTVIQCGKDEVFVNQKCINVNDKIVIEYEEVFCADNQVLFGVCIDKTPPTFLGNTSFKVQKNSIFQPLQGLEVIDDVDGDLSSEVIVTGVESTSEYGSFVLTYTVEDAAGNETIFIRTMIVGYVVGSPKGPELATNGNLSNGLNGWSFYNNNHGASMDVDVVNQVLELDIHSVSENNYYWIPRAEYQNLLFERGKTYYVAFDIWSDEERMLHLQIGDLINYDPWFVDFRSGFEKLYSTTTTRQKIEVIFTMNNSSNDDGSILFELGNIYGINTETKVYIDNLTVFELK